MIKCYQGYEKRSTEEWHQLQPWVALDWPLGGVI